MKDCSADWLHVCRGRKHHQRFDVVVFSEVPRLFASEKFDRRAKKKKKKPKNCRFFILRTFAARVKSSVGLKCLAFFSFSEVNVCLTSPRCDIHSEGNIRGWHARVKSAHTAAKTVWAQQFSVCRCSVTSFTCVWVNHQTESLNYTFLTWTLAWGKPKERRSVYFNEAGCRYCSSFLSL